MSFGTAAEKGISCAVGSTAEARRNPPAAAEGAAAGEARGSELTSKRGAIILRLHQRCGYAARNCRREGHDADGNPHFRPPVLGKAVNAPEADKFPSRHLQAAISFAWPSQVL